MNTYRLTITDEQGETVATTEFTSDRTLVAPDASGYSIRLQDSCQLLIERVEIAGQ